MGSVINVASGIAKWSAFTILPRLANLGKIVKVAHPDEG
jgi:hypothetical protein